MSICFSLVLSALLYKMIILCYNILKGGGLKMNGSNIKKLTLTAMFLSAGILLPFLFGQIPQIGSMLLPMHIPVFLCAFICGAQYAAPLAFILPLFRSLVFARPNLYPEAISIAFEMAVYAIVAGLIWKFSKRKNLLSIYISMLPAMIVGRFARCIIQIALLSLGNIPFTFPALLTGIVIAGIPGIILQLIIIPAFILIIKKSKS